jgi:hypothetical protein
LGVCAGGKEKADCKGRDEAIDAEALAHLDTPLWLRD